MRFKDDLARSGGHGCHNRRGIGKGHEAGRQATAQKREVGPPSKWHRQDFDPDMGRTPRTVLHPRRFQQHGDRAGGRLYRAR